MKVQFVAGIPIGIFVFAIAGVLGMQEAYAAEPPTDLLPYDGAVVTVPPAFSWTPGANTVGIYLNVSTEPDVNPINVINHLDDGSHYYRGTLAHFRNHKGKRLYWRLVYDGQPTPVRSFIVGEVSVDPYYNIVHIGWPGGAEGWDPHNLSSIKVSDLNALKNQVGGVGNTVDRKLAFSYHVPYFFINNIHHYRNLLSKLIEVAEQADMPVLFGLDGFQWWRGRPDLWNWWDDDKPGYDPDNRHNVEWTDWSPDAAVREGWRNWGVAFQMQEPHPNVSSERFIQANIEALEALVPVIEEWYLQLPDERKYLLAGVKIGWEVDIGANYYYPKTGNEHPDQGHQIGYAAVKIAGLASSGQLRREDLTRCIQDYMAHLTEVVYRTSIPRRKIFTHVGARGNEPTPIRYIQTDAALSPWANPGYSFYTFAAGPAGLDGLESSLNKMGQPPAWWGNLEWGGPGGGGNWDNLWSDFEQYRNCKIVCSFVGLDSASLSKIINRPPRIGTRSHWIHPPVLRSGVEDGQVTLSWDAPSQATELYLQVTTEPALNVGGGFQQITVLNERVTGTNSRILTGLKAGDYYWMIIADGHNRRVLSDGGAFSIPLVESGYLWQTH